MNKLIKISWFSVKNSLLSKEFFIGMIVAFFYSMLWGFLVHPPKYGLLDYDFEFGRFLYVIILYETVSILRNDIKSNSVKVMFTGVFSRLEIMLSKGIALIIWGFVFSIAIEVNNLITSCILYKKIGLQGFIEFPHLQLFIKYIAITVCMGSIMLFFISIIFNEKKSILLIIVLFSMINFYSAAITVLVSRQPELAPKFALYMKTFFYNTILLIQGVFAIKPILIEIAWALVFYIFSILVIMRKEIK